MRLRMNFRMDFVFAFLQSTSWILAGHVLNLYPKSEIVTFVMLRPPIHEQTWDICVFVVSLASLSTVFFFVLNA